MKIVHVLPALTKGGAERVVAELANHAATCGHTVTIVAAHQADFTLLQHYISPQVNIRFVSHSPTRKYLRLLPWLFKNRSWLLAQDVIHCHLTYGSVFGTLLTFLKKISRKRQVLIVETYHTVGMAIPAFNRKVHSVLAARRDGLALMARDNYWDAFVDRHSRNFIRIIPNGVSVPKGTNNAGDEYRKKVGIPDSCNFIIGTIGMLRPDRQPWRYIPIFAAIAKVVGQKVHFVIAGSGTEEEHVRSLIAEHKMQNQIHLAGLLSNTTPAFEIFDLYISLNVGATTGISMLEAALHQVPIIGIQMRADYTAGPEDWVWSSNKDEEIVERMIELVQSEEARQTLVARQHAHVQKYYTTEAMANAYYDFYRQAREMKTSGASQNG